MIYMIYDEPTSALGSPPGAAPTPLLRLLLAATYPTSPPWIPYGIIGLGGPSGSHVGPTRPGSSEGGMTDATSYETRPVLIHETTCSRLSIVRFDTGPKRSIRHLLGGEKNNYFSSRY